MSKKIIIPIAALFGLILLFIAAIILVIFLGGFAAYFFNSRTDTPPQSNQNIQHKTIGAIAPHTFSPPVYRGKSLLKRINNEV